MEPEINRLTQPELLQELNVRTTNISDLKMGKLAKFIHHHSYELSIFAIKNPSSWLLFSQSMLLKFKSACAIARLLRKLNYFIKDHDRSRSKDADFNQTLPLELRQFIGFTIPPSEVDNSETLEKMRLILLENKPPPKDSFSQIKGIPYLDLANWIDTYFVGLTTLKITNAKLNLILPHLKSANLNGFTECQRSFILETLREVRHLSCDQMTNDDLAIIEGYNHLTHLEISNSPEVTEDGLKICGLIPNLTYLSLRDYLLTDEELDELQIIMPKVTIDFVKAEKSVALL